uniref:Amidohydrolase-related domain-containing protein n=1 Tax=Thermofilum pendens TaxID=2269 RepID=A0A7C3SNM3_THEPE
MSLLAIKDLDFIVTLDVSGAMLRRRSIFIQDGVILGVGDYSLLAGIYGQPDLVIEGSKKIAIPGFYDMHTHLARVGFRGLFADAGERAGRLLEYLERELDAETVRKLALAGAVEALKSGVVFIADSYYFADKVAEAIVEAGLRGVVGYMYADFEGPFTGEEELRKALAHVERKNEDWQVVPALAPYSVDSVSRENLRVFAEKARELRVPLMFHLASSLEEVRRVRETTGYTPILYAYKLGLLGPGSVVAHANYASDQETILLAQSGSLIVQCPTRYFLEGLPSRAYEYWQLGGNLALGTGSPCYNDNVDFFEEMRMLVYSQRARLERTVWRAGDVLDVAIKVPARLMGFGTGVIREGARADIVLLDARRPWFALTQNIVSSIVYAANMGDVDTVIVQGRVVVSGGRHVALDEERVFHQAGAASLTLLRRALNAAPELEKILRVDRGV